MGAAGIMAGLEIAKSIPSIVTAITQGKQLKEMKRRWEGKFPTYKIPESQQQALAASRFMAMVQGAPGSRQAKEAIGRNIAGQMSAAKQAGSSSAALLGTISALGASGSEAISNQQAKDASYTASMTGRYLQQLNQMSGYEDKRYKINEFDPYMKAMQTIGALYQSKGENWNNAIGAIAGAGQSYLAAKNPDLGATMRTGSSGGAGDAGDKKTGFNSPAPNLSFPERDTAYLQFPQDAVGNFNNAFYGMEIPPATQQKYNMYDGMNQFMNQVYSSPMDYLSEG
jgi:hypothetical protein